MYEGRGPFPGAEEPVWVPFAKRLTDSRIALLSSAGFYLKSSQPAFDLDAERARPEWGDPGWRVIPADTKPADLGVAHLHINGDDLLADPEIALPMRGLGELAQSTAHHVSVMGYQERNLTDWHRTTAGEIIDLLRDQQTDGLILAPA
jgi:hypothetical protein